MLMGVKRDEAWYRAGYPDVAEAIAAGIFRDARHHFVANGYFEGRAPFQHTLDDDYYLRTYPDVADGIQSGIFSSASEHFDRFGYAEGRLPLAV